MARRRLIWHVMPAYVLVIGLCTAAVAWYAGDAVRHFYQTEAVEELNHKARLLLPQVTPLVVAGQFEQIKQLCNQLGPPSATRITVIARDGVVLGDSNEDPAVMDNHGTRPEVRQAIDSGLGQSVRYSKTIETDMMYVARPIEHDGQVVGVLRTAIALTDLSAALRNVYLRIALGGLVMAIVAAVLTLSVFSRKISRPLRMLQQRARRFATGDLARELPVPESEEIGSLTEALNSMARQLDEKIRTVTQQANERHAVLASMIEGVIAVDADERILTFNSAAARLMNIDPAAATGRGVVETIRNAELQRFIAQALQGRAPVESEIVIRDGANDRYLQAHGSVLRASGGASVGAVIVLNDVTRLRQLEHVRQQFVANVSHELKTPITAIKAAVETLQEAPPDDTEAADRFLPVIARQADRLNAIVDDLLTLARIEQEEELGQIELRVGQVVPVLRGAVETCQAKAQHKHIDLTVAGDERLRASINPALLEQAVVNLLDNAIKYSNEGEQVEVRADQVNGEVVIEVQDHGQGIEPVHLPRLFERFYRTDKARSRAIGGTGLGLAIVKHVSTAHGGHVSVDSRPGAGSTFRIHLPAR